MPPAAPFLPASERTIPRFRARVTFGRSPKSDQKRCLKPQVSRLPARLGASGNVTVYHAKIRIALIAAQRIACGPLIAAAPAYGAVGVLVYRLGDYQIAHLPPPAASVCAARWAADFFILGEHSAAVWCMGAAAGIEVQAIRCGTFLRRDCKRTKGIPKTMGLWRRSFPYFFRC